MFFGDNGNNGTCVPQNKDGTSRFSNVKLSKIIYFE